MSEWVIYLHVFIFGGFTTVFLSQPNFLQKDSEQISQQIYIWDNTNVYLLAFNMYVFSPKKQKQKQKKSLEFCNM